MSDNAPIRDIVREAIITRIATHNPPFSAPFLSLKSWKGLLESRSVPFRIGLDNKAWLGDAAVYGYLSNELPARYPWVDPVIYKHIMYAIAENASFTALMQTIPCIMNCKDELSMLRALAEEQGYEVVINVKKMSTSRSKPKFIADVFEALVGALVLEKHEDRLAVKTWMSKTFDHLMDAAILAHRRFVAGGELSEDEMRQHAMYRVPSDLSSLLIMAEGYGGPIEMKASEPEALSVASDELRIELNEWLRRIEAADLSDEE